jgi:2-C-methyl-D-erythritol 2,4-cyclodiphosphate synthase
MNIRIGEGWDVHALVPGRKLILGGVEIPHTAGLLGHSDADVLLHAITDAVLGAAGLGDIGRHFPDTDAQFKGADSSVLLAEAMRRVREKGWELVNVDSTIVAQAGPAHGRHQRFGGQSAERSARSGQCESQDGRKAWPRGNVPKHGSACGGADKQSQLKLEIV